MNYPLRRRLPTLSLQETFLRLAQMTTPHGYESYCWPLLPLADSDHYIDEHDNVHIWVRRPDNDYSNVMWSSHLDTADGGKPKVVQFRKTKKGKISTDGKTILGADCKIGAALMVKMIEAGVPGWYIFHAGEERGLIGARANARAKWPYIPNCAIAFDRKDRNEIITHQAGRRTASEAFAKAFAAILNKQQGFEYKPSDGGVYTDTQAYEGIIPECTNIGVGYFKQHTTEECQDMDHADKLLAVILDNKFAFEDLPCPRNPKKDNESRHYQSYTPTKGGNTGGYIYRDGQWFDCNNQPCQFPYGQGNNSPKANGSGSITARSESGRNDGAPDPNDEQAYIRWWQERGYKKDSPNGHKPTPTDNEGIFICDKCGEEDQGYSSCRECGGAKFVRHYGPPPSVKKVHVCNTCKRIEVPGTKWEHEAQFCPTCGDPMLYQPCPHFHSIPDGQDGRMICDDCDHETCPARDEDVPPFKADFSTPIKIVTDAKMTEDVIPLADEEDKGAVIDRANEQMTEWKKMQEKYAHEREQLQGKTDELKRGNVRGVGGLGKAKRKVHSSSLNPPSRRNLL